MSLLFTVSNIKGCVSASDRPGTTLPFPDRISASIALGGKSQEAVDRWRPVVREFLDSGRIAPKSRFSDYALAFYDFVKDLPMMQSGDEAEAVLQGYGDEELFPSVACIPLGKGTETLSPDSLATSFHPYATRSQYHVIGDEEDVQALIHGIAAENEPWYAQELARTARKLKKRLVAKAEESGDAKAVKYLKKNVRVSDAVGRLEARQTYLIDGYFLTPFRIAVESFNMDDLIGMAERLVDLSGMMKHFLEGETGYALTKEIAIVTRAEGFVWIKQA